MADDPNPPLPAEDLLPAKGAPPEDVWVEGDHPTENPDGVTNSNVDYWPKTQEEKAQAMGVPMATVLQVDPTAPYEAGAPPTTPEEADAMLRRLHTPAERVPGEHNDYLQEVQLAAGGSVDLPMDADHPAASGRPPEPPIDPPDEAA